MRRLFIFSLNLSETSLSSWDLLGLEVFTAFSGRLDTGGKNQENSVLRLHRQTLQQHEWVAIYAWCETTRDLWVGVSLTYAWTMSPPLPAQETLNELPTYLGFSDRDSIGPRGTSHCWTRKMASGQQQMGNSDALPGLTAEPLREEATVIWGAIACWIK